MVKCANRITKRLSRLQDKLENGKLSPKQIGKLRPKLNSWKGVIDLMAKDIDAAYPQKTTEAAEQGSGKTTPGQHG